MNRACFPEGKTPEFTEMGEIHELFVLALSLAWFAGATREQNSNRNDFKIAVKSLAISNCSALSGSAESQSDRL